MRIRLIPIFLGLGVGISFLGSPPAAAVAQGVVAVPVQGYWVAPPLPVAFAAGPKRAYRYAALPVYAGVYGPPRQVYPGYLAPWGSLPADYHAASYPLAHRVPGPVAILGLPSDTGDAMGGGGPVGPDDVGLPPRLEPPRQRPGPALEPPRIEAPETIPTPPPLEAPSVSPPPRKSGNGGRTGGLINPGQSVPQARPVTPPASATR